jgi:hypothetical protein
MTRVTCVLHILLAVASGQVERWVYRHNGTGDYDDQAQAIAVAADGSLYAAGWSWGSASAYDFTVVGLTPSGTQSWVYAYNGPANDWDEARSIVAGPDTNLYAAGCSRGTGSSYDFTVVSVTASGAERWVYRYNGPGNYDDAARAIALGPDGNVYAAGCSFDSASMYDWTVVGLTPLGAELWVYHYNGPGNHHDWAYSILIGADENLYCAGFSTGSATFADFTVVSLTSAGGIGDPPPGGMGPEAPFAVSAAPVPSAGPVNIGYSIPGPAGVRLAIYDGFGRLVKRLSGTGGGCRRGVLTWDGSDRSGRAVAPGVYFVRPEHSSLSARIVIWR